LRPAADPAAEEANDEAADDAVEPIREPAAPLEAEEAADSSTEFQAPAAADPAVAEESARGIDPIERAAVEPPELPMRTWSDNTGNFQIRGRLAVILDGKVRIFKENGRYTTVSLERLSDADRDYVEQKLAEFGLGEIGDLAAR
jgi:hypothetical protein